MNMKRVTIIFAVVTVLLLADGLWMQLTHYHPDDQNSFFGNGNIVLSDGQVLLISGGFLFLATVVMWLVAVRRGVRTPARSHQRSGGRSASKV
jgi:cell division protein FtsX